MNENENVRKHHPLSPSNYPAWAECPSWEGGGRQSSESSEGTRAHEEFSRLVEGRIAESEIRVAAWAAQSVRDLAAGAIVSCEERLEGNVPLGDGTVEAGVFGYADAVWIDWDASAFHVADLKTFSDGTDNYVPQLMGYAALAANKFGFAEHGIERVFLHVLHGGAFRVETVESTVSECVKRTAEIIVRRKTEGFFTPILCKWCKFCRHVASCPATNSAVQKVADNAPSFSRLSLCQKLVVCDAVVKLAEALKKQAKEIAEASPDKSIEMDGIRYELKPWADKPKCRDITELASAVDGDGDKFTIREIDTRTAEITATELNPIPPEEFIALCEVSKKRVVDAVMKKNEGNPSVKRRLVDSFVSRYFDRVDGTPHFVRTK